MSSTSASRLISSTSSTTYAYDHEHNTATGLHSTSFSPSSSSTSPTLSSLYPRTNDSTCKMFSPPNRTRPIPLAQPILGRQSSHFSNAGAGGSGSYASGSYGAHSLARSLMMGSYGNGSLEERMRMGSWKGKFLGSEGGPQQLPLGGGIDAHDFSLAQMSTSIDSNNGSMKMARNEADYCQNYNCCGVELSSMHDLLEHYEDVHVVILPSPMTHASGLPEDVDSMDLDSEPPSSSSSASSSSQQSIHSNSNSPPLNRRQPIPASAPLQFSDVLAPPPLGSSSSLLSTEEDSLSAADGRKKTKQALAGRAAFLTTSTGGSVAGEDASWAGGASPNRPNAIASSSSSVVPTALFPASSNPSANPHDAANLNNASNHTASSLLAAAQAACATDPSSATAHISLPQSLTTNPSLVQPSGIPPPPGSGQKTFHCPTPGCQKSYKQQNGLKYHLKVGQCNFEVRDAVENGLSEAEAEEKSRPFLCQVGGGCTKRYRQMNGLRYHYLNSGAHGAIGLALVAQGKHGHPKGAGGADSNGFTAKAAMGTAGSPLALGTGKVEPQQQQMPTPVVPNPLDEVLFTVGEEDVDMMME